MVEDEGTDEDVVGLSTRGGDLSEDFEGVGEVVGEEEGGGFE